MVQEKKICDNKKAYRASDQKELSFRSYVFFFLAVIIVSLLIAIIIDLLFFRFKDDKYIPANSQLFKEILEQFKALLPVGEFSERFYISVPETNPEKNLSSLF